MLFNSFAFLVFYCVVFTLYYLPFGITRKHQLEILIAASFFFYGYGNPSLLLLLLFSVAINATGSYLLTRVSNDQKRMVLITGVIINLLILCFFKYSGLLVSSLYPVSGSVDSMLHWLVLIPLPIGISFYTFEGISLLADLNSGKAKLEADVPFSTHLLKAAFFISFFPHLIAGPILKARDFYPQMGRKLFRDIDWETGIKQLVLGFFLKMVVADNLKDITADIAYPYFEQYASGNLVLLVLAYSMQIFADFAGYSLIALGLATVLGYRLPINFNFPYIAASFSAFWRRWHISLSTWLRDYLYIPLGGNRKGAIRTYLNLLIVMVLGGLWHGAAWSYAVWGGMHGLLLMAERYIGVKKGNVYRIAGTLLVFTSVTALWLLFKLNNFSEALAFVKALKNNIGLPLKVGYREVYIVLFTGIVFLYHAVYLLQQNRPRLFSPYWKRMEVFAYGILLFLIITNSGDGGAFIYFQF